MITKTCDVCTERIEAKTIAVQLNGKAIFEHFDFCEVCAKPVLEFLAKEKLWKDKSLNEHEVRISKVEKQQA